MLTLKTLAKIGAVFAISTAAATNVQAAGVAQYARGLVKLDPVKHIMTRQTTLAPFSFVMFCHSSPSDCRGGTQAVVEWDQSNKALVSRINRSVNYSIRPKHDTSDVWTVGGKFGDCEDFALTKRHQLVRAGIPAAALRMAVAVTREGEGHAVLVVRTTAGDLVLDNRTDSLRQWNKTDLSWQKIASGENPRIWYAID